MASYCWISRCFIRQQIKSSLSQHIPVTGLGVSETSSTRSVRWSIRDQRVTTESAVIQTSDLALFVKFTAFPCRDFSTCVLVLLRQNFLFFFIAGEDILQTKFSNDISNDCSGEERFHRSSDNVATNWTVWQRFRAHFAGWQMSAWQKHDIDLLIHANSTRSRFLQFAVLLFQRYLFAICLLFINFVRIRHTGSRSRRTNRISRQTFI